MKENRMRKLIGILLMLFLVLGSTNTVLAATKNTEEIFDLFYYLPETVPESYRAGLNKESVEVRVVKGNTTSWEDATSMTATFVSGDEVLKEAVQTVKKEEKAYCYISLKDIKTPVNAVFHFTCEAGGTTVEKDQVLRTLSWEEHPLFTKVMDDPIITVSQGDSLMKSQIISSVYDMHTDDINAALGVDCEAADYFPFVDFKNHETGEGISTYDEGAPIVGHFFSFSSDQEYQFLKSGIYDALFDSWDSFGIKCNETVTIVVVPYTIACPRIIAPGETVTFHIQDDQPEAGRTFELKLEGESVIMDENKCTLTAMEDAECGSTFTLTAIPSDGGNPVVLQGTIHHGALEKDRFILTKLQKGGFSVPVLSNTEMDQSVARDYYGIGCYPKDDEPYNLLEVVEASSFGGIFVDDYHSAKDILEKIEPYPNMDNIKREIVEINGWPVLLHYGRYNEETSVGEIVVIRNNTYQSIIVNSVLGEGGQPEQLPLITRDDLIMIAEQIRFNETGAFLRKADGEIILKAKDNLEAITAGKRLQFNASFANPERVNKKEKNDTIEWSVVDQETQLPVENVTIDKNGNLLVNDKLADVKKLEVKASSPFFHTEATWQITALPKVKKLSVEPGELTFYEGTNTTKTAKAILEPDTVPPIGIIWVPGRKDIVEIIAGDDGTAEIKPIVAGKITVNVREPGGKSGVLKINIIKPVVDLELSANGKPQAGRMMNIAAKLSPQNAGDKTLEWSLNVGEDVATINPKGQIKISNTAQQGTIITVTCKALGAPEPIVKTLDIIVE